jgi:hypothetical protein
VTRRTTRRRSVPIIRILIQSINPKIISRVIRRRERNKRKGTIRSRPSTLNRRPLRIRIKALRRSQRIRSQRTTMTIRSLVYL